MAAIFSPTYTLAAPPSSSRSSMVGPSSSSSSTPPTAAAHRSARRPLSLHQPPAYSSSSSSPAAAGPPPSKFSYPSTDLQSTYAIPSSSFLLGRSQSSTETSPKQARSSPTAASSSSTLKDRRRPPPPIVINPHRQSSFVFPPSPTEDDCSPMALPRGEAVREPTTMALASQFPDPPSWTPPVSPKPDDGERFAAAPARRPSSSVPASARHGRKASLVDGQLFSAPFADGPADTSVESLSPAARYAASVAGGSAPPTPRRMSVAGSGTRRRSSASHGNPTPSPGYASFGSCLDGALAHEKKANTYDDTAQGPSPKALHHFTRAHELLDRALELRPADLEVSIYKAGVSLILARRFLPPSDALRKAQSALTELRCSLSLNADPLPKNFFIASQVQLASLTSLLASLSEGLYLSMVPRAIWKGEVGDLARESVRLWEEIVACEDAAIKEGFQALVPGADDGADQPWDEDDSTARASARSAERERRGSSFCHRRITEEAHVASHLSLADAAQFAASLAPDLINADKYFDVAERAVEGAYRTARDLRAPASSGALQSATRMSAAKMTPPPVVSASPLMYQAYLRLGPLKMERLRHTIEVSLQFPLNHLLARSVLADMGRVAEDLASIARGRAADAGALAAEPFVAKRDAKTLAVQALTQLGDAEYLLAHLLKRIWHRRSSTKAAGSSQRRPAPNDAAQPPPPAGRRSSGEAEPGVPPADSRRASLEERRQTSIMSRRESFVDKHTIVEEESEEEKDSPKRAAAAGAACDDDRCATPVRCGSVASSLSRALFAQALDDRRTSLSSAVTPSRPSSIRRTPSSASLSSMPLASPTGHRPSWMSDSAVSPSAASSRMSMAQYRRISAAGSLRSVQSDDDIYGTAASLLSSSAPVAVERRASSALKLPKHSRAASEDAPPSPPPSTEELAEQAWDLLASAMRNYKDAFSLLKPSRSGSSAGSPSSLLAPSASSLAFQRANILLAVSLSAYFRASLAPRIAAAKDSRTSLLVSAEVYSTWAAREVGWEWLVEDQPRPDDFATPSAPTDRPLAVSRHAAVGQKAIFTLLRTVWHRAVTGGAGEVSKEDKRAAKARVETVVLRLKAEAGCGAYDITRFKVGIERFEGEFEQGESLFWAGLSRTLKGQA